MLNVSEYEAGRADGVGDYVSVSMYIETAAYFVG